MVYILRQILKKERTRQRLYVSRQPSAVSLWLKANRMEAATVAKTKSHAQGGEKIEEVYSSSCM
jgi:hypothetical protein